MLFKYVENVEYFEYVKYFKMVILNVEYGSEYNRVL